MKKQQKSSSKEELKEKHEWHQKKRKQQQHVFEEIEEFGLEELNRALDHEPDVGKV